MHVFNVCVSVCTARFSIGIRDLLTLVRFSESLMKCISFVLEYTHFLFFLAKSY